MTQLDRIEQKLDRILRTLCLTEPASDTDVKAAVYASGGIKGLKDYMKADSERKAKGDGK